MKQESSWTDLVYGRTDPCDLWAIENTALVFSYFSVGLVSSFISTPLNIYMIEVLDAEPRMQNTIGILQTLPWSLKLIFGFLSDAVPICGMHRKPYFVTGCLLYSGAFILYALSGIHNTALLACAVFIGTLGLIMFDVMTDTMCVERSRFESDAQRGQMQASCYSIRFAGGVIGALLGTLVSNADSPMLSWYYLDFAKVSLVNGLIPFMLVTPFLWHLKEHYVSKSDSVNCNSSSSSGSVTESDKIKSSKANSSPYSTKGGSNKLVSLTPERRGTSRKDSKSFFSTDYGTNESNPSIELSPLVLAIDVIPHSIQGAFDDSTKVSSYVKYAPIEDDPYGERLETILASRRRTPKIGEQINEIWLTVQLQAVWRPMAFVYCFNFFQVPNVAWQSYLQLTLRFEPWILGLTVTLGSFMTFAGVLAYKYWFFKSSWKNIYLWSACLTTFFSLLQLCLIFQVNSKYFHLSNYLFSMGDDVISAYISGIQFLPVCIMYMRLCPEGAEGSSYSMLTTFGNIALVCASSLGSFMSNIWDVSNDTLRAGDVSGLWKLNLLTSCLSLLPLSLIFLLPQNAQEQDELSNSKIRSKTGGIVFLSVLFVSLAWSISQAVLSVMFS